MKTLVIHPEDHTTDFLKRIYKDRDWTICTKNISNSKIRKLIKEHDRIIMMGHGTGYGLIGHGKHFISPKHVQALREKICICIWCNSDFFVNKYKLPAQLYTGMIISEYDEAVQCEVYCKVQDITNSNYFFTTLMTDAINNETVDLDKIIKPYKEKADINSVIAYNSIRIYSNL